MIKDVDSTGISKMPKLAILGGKPVRNDFLPPFRPTIGDEEINEVIDTLKSDWITTGPKTHKFEELFKEYIGSKNAIALNSCTAGLHLSLIVYGIGAGDEIITSPFTFAATANVITHQKAKPVFVDIEKDTYNINSDRIEEAVTDKTKAIIPVHYAGHPCEMDAILKIAKEYDLRVIEDAAHALGAVYKGRKMGTIGDLTSFSFYATKNLTTAEGGMVTTDNDELAEKIRIMSLHGISKDAWKRYSSEGSWYYEILYPGYKYNMTDIQAAIGIHQLKKLEQMQKRRGEIAKKYNEAFTDIPEIINPTVKRHVRHAWHLYPIQVNTDLLRIDRAKFIDALKAENIGTSVHFIPIHLHPYYHDRYGFKRGDFPNAESVYERECSLPIYPKMTDKDVEDVIVAVKKIVRYYRK
jgi:UDP-4-amino-4,6-dideoxy-N-acetyl-beta-L-altrosamine transaminase